MASAEPAGDTAGTTFNVQRFSVDDGPGIRTTAFFKGCPLRCAWCHNPEGMHGAPELIWHASRCVGARDCLAVCPESALGLDARGMSIDRERCEACGRCAAACPTAALELVGRRWRAGQLLAELERDRPFFAASGGGITLSGGEPLLQRGFLAELLPRCGEAGLHVALDTCAAVPWSWLEPLVDAIDLVLLDVKLADDARHRAATGHGNGEVLENLARLARADVPLWIRTPVIPGFTDDEQNVAAIGSLLRPHAAAVQRWELVAYTDLGRPKYEQLGRPYRLAGAPLLRRELLERLCAIASEALPVARWKGATDAG